MAAPSGWPWTATASPAATTLIGALNQGGRLESCRRPPSAGLLRRRRPGDHPFAGRRRRRGRGAFRQPRPRGGHHLPALGRPAGGRLETATPALNVDLRVPPGWSLFATAGVDSSSGAWADRWRPARLLPAADPGAGPLQARGLLPAAVALPLLVLGWHERYALALVWLLLGLLALRGLARLRAEGGPASAAPRPDGGPAGHPDPFRALAMAHRPPPAARSRRGRRRDLGLAGASRAVPGTMRSSSNTTSRTRRPRPTRSRAASSRRAIPSARPMPAPT